MRIDERYRFLYEINENDTPEQINFKKYMIKRDRIEREILDCEREKEFGEKYNKIMRMRNKTSLEQLKLQVAVEELLDDYKK
jgi:hypothetical protein